MFIFFLLRLASFFILNDSVTSRGHTDVTRIPKKVPIQPTYKCNTLSYLDPPFWFCKELNFPNRDTLLKTLSSHYEGTGDIIFKRYDLVEGSSEQEKTIMLYYIHITKAAGTTMNDIFKKIVHTYYGYRHFYAAGPEFPTTLQIKQNWPRGKLNYPCFVSLERNWGTGAVIFGLSSGFKRSESKKTQLLHMLFLREPVARTKSHWTHHERKKNHNHGCSKFKGRFIEYFNSCCVPSELNKFCGCALDCRQFVNFQTYMTSNKIVSSSEPHIWSQEIPSIRNAIRIFDKEYENLTEAFTVNRVLQDSLENIDHAGFIGIVEYMTISICLFYDTFYLHEEFSEAKCATPPSGTQRIVSKLNFNKLSSSYKTENREEQLFREINAVDTILYDYSKKLFLKRWTALLERYGVAHEWSTYMDKVKKEL